MTVASDIEARVLLAEMLELANDYLWDAQQELEAPLLARVRVVLSNPEAHTTPASHPHQPPAQAHTAEHQVRTTETH